MCTKGSKLNNFQCFIKDILKGNWDFFKLQVHGSKDHNNNSPTAWHHCLTKHPLFMLRHQQFYPQLLFTINANINIVKKVIMSQYYYENDFDLIDPLKGSYSLHVLKISDRSQPTVAKISYLEHVCEGSLLKRHFKSTSDRNDN